MFRQKRLHRILLFLLLAVLVTPGAWAGTVGKISGTITNEANGQPLTGANVTIVGTTMGASADAAGKFAILNVPAGTYSVQATLVGYKPILMQNITVAPDFTTEVNFALTQTVLGIVQTVEIRAEKPLIQKDLTGTTRFIGREDIQNMPTRGYQDAASLQAGVTSQQINQDLSTADLESSNSPRLHVRGGRAEEVAYFVDGFSQQDPLTGLSTTSINQNAIDQIVVLTGGFNAEYGKIMSGAVNVITREGAPKYFGAIEAITDNLAGSWIGAKKYDNNIYDVSLGGPVFPGSDQLTFFVSGERRWQRDRSPHPIDKLGYTEDQKKLFLRDGLLPNNSLGGYTWQGKVTWALSNSLKLRGGTLGSKDEWREYHHQYLYNQAHMPRYEDWNKSVFGTATYTFNPKTFANLGVNWFYTERFRGDGVYFKDLSLYPSELPIDPATGDPVGNPRYPENAPLFWYGGQDTTKGSHVWDDYLHRESSYIGAKGDVAFQWSPTNQAKLGVEYRRHTLRRYRHLFPVQVWQGISDGGYNDVDGFGYVLDDPEKHLDSGIDGAKHPKDASFFVQNKYEKDQFVLNAGIRYDYLNAETDVLANNSLPLGEDRTTLDSSDLKKGKVRNKISPRLGVGFPVSERTQFHANYGLFFQQPNLENLYTGYGYLGYKAKVGGYYYPFGNPDLAPETTTAYEVGFTQQLAANARLDVTAFYKNVQDLVQVESIRSSPNSYTTFRNTDYGTIKGVDFAFDMRRTQSTTATVNYTFSYANGTGSVSNTQRNIAWTGGIAPKQTSPLDFDQRHKIAVNLDWRLGRGQGPMLGSVRPLEDFGVNLLFNMASGIPYTPTKAYDEVTLAAVNIEPAGPINSRYGPWTYRVDLKADRTFNAGGLDINAYVWVLNVLNRKNPASVYTSSGVSNETGWLSNPIGERAYSTAEQQELYNLAQLNPNNYDVPRMVRFGLKTSF
jgi:outer membrane receptor protein involved in Fe transport